MPQSWRMLYEQLKNWVHVITSQKTVKYLGVFLDQTLSMSKHISEKCRVASYNLHIYENLGNISPLSQPNHLLIL